MSTKQKCQTLRNRCIFDLAQEILKNGADPCPVNGSPSSELVVFFSILSAYLMHFKDDCFDVYQKLVWNSLYAETEHLLCVMSAYPKVLYDNFVSKQKEKVLVTLESIRPGSTKSICDLRCMIAPQI